MTDQAEKWYQLSIMEKSVPKGNREVDQYTIPKIRASETILRLDSLSGIQRVWLYLQKKQKLFPDFLATLVTMVNNYPGKKVHKETILNAIKRALDDSRIPYELFHDDDEVFYFPNGAKELDGALVSEPLEWLSDYPKARVTFARALKQYSDGAYVRDVADNFRKSLEEFFQEFLGNKKNLDNNKAEIYRYVRFNFVEDFNTGFKQFIQSISRNEKTT